MPPECAPSDSAPVLSKSPQKRRTCGVGWNLAIGQRISCVLLIIVHTRESCCGEKGETTLADADANRDVMIVQCVHVLVVVVLLFFFSFCRVWFADVVRE